LALLLFWLHSNTYVTLGATMLTKMEQSLGLEGTFN